MLLLENIILAINGLLSNKTRAFLTMLGIIIGIGSVIAILTVGNSLTQSVSENMQSMGANDIYVMLEQREKKEEEGKIDGIKFGALEQNEALQTEDYITSEMIHEMCDKYPDEIYAINIEQQIGSSNIEVEKKSTQVSVSGVSPGYFVTNRLEMLAGSMFSAQDFEGGKHSILVSDEFVKALFEENNQKALGTEIEINCNHIIDRFTIVGIYKNENVAMMGMSSSPTIYMPLKTANNYMHSADEYMYFQVITKVGVDADELSGKLETFFEPYYRNNHSFGITVMMLRFDGFDADGYVIDDYDCHFGNCWNCVIGWWNWCHEYYACFDYRKDARNWYEKSVGGEEQFNSCTIYCRSNDYLLDWWSVWDCTRCKRWSWFVEFIGISSCSIGFGDCDFAIIFNVDWYIFRLLPSQQGG